MEMQAKEVEKQAEARNKAYALSQTEGDSEEH